MCIRDRYKISKQKTKRLSKVKNIKFRSVDFTDFFMRLKSILNSPQIRSKHKLVGENTLTSSSTWKLFAPGYVLLKKGNIRMPSPSSNE